MFPQKNVKIQGVAGAFWGGFDTRAQLTVHTRALTYCASESPPLEPRLPRRKRRGDLNSRKRGAAYTCGRAS